MIKLISTVKTEGQIQSSQPQAAVFKIPVKWQIRTFVNVKAHSLKEAVQSINLRQCELPSRADSGNSECVDDSFEIDYDFLEDF